MKRLLFCAAIAVVAMAHQAGAEPLKLRFGTSEAGNAPMVQEVLIPWAKRVSEASGGEVSIEVVAGGTLGNYQVMYDRVVANVANIGTVFTPYYQGKFPKTDVLSIPFEVDSATEGSIAFWRLYKQGVLSDEYKQVELLFPMVFAPAKVLSRTPITKPSDMKGLKVAVAGKMRSAAAQLLGAAPVSLRINEIYQALSTNVIDASMNPFYALKQFHLDEVASNMFAGSFGTGAMVTVMNKDVWNKLSDKAKNAFRANSGEVMARTWGEWLDGKETEIREKLEATKKFKVVVPTAAEKKEWRALLKPIADDWVKSTPGGRQVLDALRGAVGQISAKN